MREEREGAREKVRGRRRERYREKERESEEMEDKKNGGQLKMKYDRRRKNEEV